MSQNGSKERKAEGREKREKEKTKGTQHKKMSWGRRRCRQPERSRRSNCLKKAGEAPATRKVGGGPLRESLLRELPAPPALPQGGRDFFQGLNFGSILWFNRECVERLFFNEQC